MSLDYFFILPGAAFQGRREGEKNRERRGRKGQGVLIGAPEAKGVEGGVRGRKGKAQI